jgi:hypothetical protein
LTRTAPTRSRTRRALVALIVAAAGLAASAGLGTGPAGAGVPSFCEGAPKFYVCHTYYAFFRRTSSEAEMQYWVDRMPAQKALMVSTIGRAGESRRRTIERYYDVFADRDPSDGEKAYWEGEILKTSGLRRLEAALLAELDGDAGAFVEWAYATVVGREPHLDEFIYWEGRAEAQGYNLTAAALAGTPEVRRTRVHWTFWNELGHAPDVASRDYWAERLKTGLSYLDLRISLRLGSYPDVTGYCSSLAPPTEHGCG